MTDWPKIKARRTIDVSPWMKVIERAVEFTPDSAPELYHAVAQPDYIAIVALMLLAAGAASAQQTPQKAIFKSLMTKALADYPGKEVLVLTVVYPPGALPAFVAPAATGDYGTAFEFDDVALTVVEAQRFDPRKALQRPGQTGRGILPAGE